MRWAETQRAFIDAIRREGAVTSIGPSIRGDAKQRLSIYRNNVNLTLMDALAETYRAIYHLVGEEYFQLLAMGYIERTPANSANLNDYGASFDAFIAEHPVAKQLPYLVDMARYEWAWQRSFYAADAQPACSEMLQTLDDESVITLHPSVQCVQLTYPAEAIWRYCMLQQGEGDAPDMSSRTYAVCLYRNHAGIQVIEPENHAIIPAIQGLISGKKLNESIPLDDDEQLRQTVDALIRLLIEAELIISVT